MTSELNRSTAHPSMPATLDVLLIQLEHEIYAVPSTCVREITRLREVTAVPGAPAALPGIINNRGVILPVIELRSLLGLDMEPLTRTARLVIVQQAEMELALIADAVIDLVELLAETVEPAPGALDPARANLISGIARHDDQVVVLLDLAMVITALRGGAEQ